MTHSSIFTFLNAYWSPFPVFLKPPVGGEPCEVPSIAACSFNGEFISGLCGYFCHSKVHNSFYVKIIPLSNIEHFQQGTFLWNLLVWIWLDDKRRLLKQKLFVSWLFCALLVDLKHYLPVRLFCFKDMQTLPQCPPFSLSTALNSSTLLVLSSCVLCVFTVQTVKFHSYILTHTHTHTHTHMHESMTWIKTWIVF